MLGCSATTGIGDDDARGEIGDADGEVGFVNPDGEEGFANADDARWSSADSGGPNVICVPGGLDTDEFYIPACEDGVVSEDGSRPAGSGGDSVTDSGTDAGSETDATIDARADAGSETDAATGAGTDAGSGTGDPCAGLMCNDDGVLVSCCDGISTPAGSFRLGRCGSAGAGCTDAYDGYNTEIPEHDANLSAFVMDRFEVTVGRFRRYVEQYDGKPPAEGAGEHPAIPGSGWQSAWNGELPANQAELRAQLECPANSSFKGTWTDTPDTQEDYAINCVTWYDAFAFCIWEGKRLPTNAEWEYVAAGGEENRLFPWGSALPTEAHANCLIGKDTSGTPEEWDAQQFRPVGSYPLGAGRWGHLDLAGNMGEWVLDTMESNPYPTGTAPCNDCADLVPGPSDWRVLKGSNIHGREKDLRSAARLPGSPVSRTDGVGFRCAW